MSGWRSKRYEKAHFQSATRHPVNAVSIGFSSVLSGFPPFTNNNTSKFEFDQETVAEEPLSGSLTTKSRF